MKQYFLNPRISLKAIHFHIRKRKRNFLNPRVFRRPSSSSVNHSLLQLQEVTKEYFHYLPEEIVLDILSRVPTESVLVCKSVCKSWNNFVSHPSFSNMHSHHHLNHAGDSGKLGFIAMTFEEFFYYFEYNENHEYRITRLNFKSPFGWDHFDTIFLGSCNGLFCLAQEGYLAETSFICNPITKEYVMLPGIKGVGYTYGATGFGYVSSTNEYKVVRMLSKVGTDYIEAYVYTLGSGLGWRNLGKFNLRTVGDGLFANGFLYWWDTLDKMIFPFDLAEEMFCERISFPLPDHDFDSDSDDEIDEDVENEKYRFRILDGCLSFAVTGNVDGGEFWDNWGDVARFWDIRLLKKKNDDDDNMKEREQNRLTGWSEEFRVYDNGPFAVTKSSDVLTYYEHYIYIQDPEASTSKRIVDFKEDFVGVFPHKNTLISLKELGEEDTKIMESAEETENHDQPFNQP